MKSSLQHRRFLSHKLVCIPTYDRPEGICDFVFRTAGELAAQNVVIILALGESWRGKTGWKHWLNGVTQARSFLPLRTADQLKALRQPIYLGVFQFLPFQRFSFSKYLNLQLNLLLFSLLIGRQQPDAQRILWIFHPQDIDVLPFFKSWHLHFDCVDWHTTMDVQSRQKLDQQRRLLIQAARSITVLTRPVLSRIEPLAQIAPRQVPQGFDLQGFKTPTQPPLAVRRKLQKLRKETRPLIGFFGGVNQRLDVEMLLRVTQQHPEWNFLFVGPRGKDQSVGQSEASEKKLDQLLRKTNVTWIQLLKRNQLLPMMKECDVLIVPYDLQWEFNVCCFPMKIMEYFFAQRPVVSTPIPSLLDYKEFVFFGNTSRQFSRAIQKALQVKWLKDQQQKLRNIALNQTWKRKLDSVDEYLSEMIPST